MGQSIMRDTFPPEQLPASQGIFALGAIMGPTLGPPLGGYLVDNFSWNWCFEINVLPGIFSVVVLLLLLRDPSKANRGTPIDAVGLGLLAVGLAGLQYVLTEGEQNDWFNDSTILLIAVICMVSLLTFVWWELTQTENPVVDLRILRNRSVWAGTILALSLGVSVFGASYTLPQFTQGSLGWTPTLSGCVVHDAGDPDRARDADRRAPHGESRSAATCSARALSPRPSGRICRRASPRRPQRSTTSSCRSS